ncbi:glycosyltransferase family 39 protein [Planctomicrobium sp. SH664]|uniref:glycosyltransferase family 39 protein n=1 Tax=Planctomicrobium sp. SH664 TaxID=3448125 RepID=UPI003F5CA247
MRLLRSLLSIRLLIGLALLLAVGCALAGFTPFTVIRSRLDAYSGDGSADPYTSALHRQLQWACWSAALLIAATLLICRSVSRRFPEQLSQFRSNLREDVRRLWNITRDTCRENAFALVSLTLLAALFRLLWLNMPMRYDEAYTWLNYASQPWFIVLSKYDEPNHHIFHNLLVHCSARLFGDAPWALRLPAWLAGVLVVPLTFALGKFASGRWGAMIAGLIACGSTALIEYSTNARGYSMMTLLILTGWMGAISLRELDNRAGAVLLILSGSLGLWTVPTMLIPLCMIWLWLFLASPGMRTLRQLTVVVTGTLGCTALLYAPVLIVWSPLRLLTGTVQNGASAVDRWPHTLRGLSATGALLIRDWPLPALLVGLAAIAFVVMDRSPRSRLIRLAGLSLAAGVGAATLIGTWPPPRTWVFLIPLVAVGVGSGTRLAMDRIPLLRQPLLWTSTWSLFAGISLIYAATSQSIDRSSETGLFTEAEQVIHDLSDILQPNDRIVSVTPASSALVYYAQREGIDPVHFERPTPGNDLVVVISKSYGKQLQQVFDELELKDLRPEQFQKVRDYPDAEMYAQPRKSSAQDR